MAFLRQKYMRRITYPGHRITSDGIILNVQFNLEAFQDFCSLKILEYRIMKQ